MTSVLVLEQQRKNMAKKATQKTPAELEAEVMSGVPPQVSAEVDPPADDAPKKDAVTILREQVEALTGEVTRLRTSRPQKEVEPPAPTPKEEEPDWEKLWFEDPKAAVRLIKEQTKREVEERVKKDYTQDVRQREFWSEFYDQHEDLRDDDDLVKLTLQNNLRELQDLPVGDASKRLAELTRERIVRYAGGRKHPVKRVEVEGSSRPSAEQRVEEDTNIVTLGDLIKRRREKRRLASTKGTAA